MGSNVLGLLFIVLFMIFTSTKTQENDKEDCGQYNDCSSCITKHQCQYVIWESEMKNISDVKICVDITLPELEVRKLGPLGNIDDDTHWEMKSFHNETKCHLHHAKKAHSLISKVAQGAFGKSIGVPNIEKTDTNSSDISLDLSNIPTSESPSEGPTNQNLDDIIPTPSPIDVNKINKLNSNSDDTFNGDQPSSSKYDSTFPEKDDELNQEIDKDVKKSQRILTEKADLIQNGAYKESSFDIGSFIGGAVLVIVFNVICVFGVRYYRMRGSRNYNYLLWGESNA